MEIKELNEQIKERFRIWVFALLWCLGNLGVSVSCVRQDPLLPFLLYRKQKCGHLVQIKNRFAYKD